MRPGSMRRLTPRSACTPAKRLCTPRTSRKGTAASGGAGTGVIAGSERVLLVVGLVHVHPGLAGDDHALARAFLDADLVVAPRAQVHAVGDRLAVEQQLGHLVHHQAGVFRVPETDAVDGTGLQVFARVLRQADAEHAGLVLQPGFFPPAADADRVDRRTALETLDVGVLAQDFLGLFVGFVGVVEGLVVRVHQRHLRVLGRVARPAAPRPPGACGRPPSAPTKVVHFPPSPMHLGSRSFRRAPKAVLSKASISACVFLAVSASCVTTTMPRSIARLSTPSIVLGSIGTTAMALDFLATRSSITRSCCAGSPCAGPTMLVATLALAAPNSLTPSPMRVNQFTPMTLTTVTMLCLSCAHAAPVMQATAASAHAV